MINRMRYNVIVTILGITIVFTTIASPYTQMIGKYYLPAKDYTCCKNDQLYVYHYYSNKFLWIKTTQGYTAEAVGKPIPGGCYVQCLSNLK